MTYFYWKGDDNKTCNVIQTVQKMPKVIIELFHSYCSHFNQLQPPTKLPYSYFNCHQSRLSGSIF